MIDLTISLPYELCNLCNASLGNADRLSRQAGANIVKWLIFHEQFEALTLRRRQRQHAAAESTRLPVPAAAAPSVLDRADGLLHEGCLVQSYSSQDAGVLRQAERRDDADERQDDLRLLSGLFRERRLHRLQPQGTTASLPTVRVAVHQSLAHSRLHLLRSETCCLSV